VRIAVCEAGPLTPYQDAGSRAVVDLIEGYQILGHEVSVFIESDQDLPAKVTAFAPELIFGSRPGLFVRIQPQLSVLGVPMVYMAHDLHFVRVGLEQALGGRPVAAASVLRLVEKQCFATADLTILPTKEEADQVAHDFPGARTLAVNYFAMPIQPDRLFAPDDYLVAFVGGAHHAPNRDGIHWFVHEVWTPFVARRPGARLVVCGRWGTADRLSASGVEFTGVVSDEELDAILGSARVGIAPLRFGAGMKRKTLHYLSHALPVIGTSFAVQGLAEGQRAAAGVVPAESAQEFAAALELLADDEAWLRLAAAGTHFVRERFSTDRHLADLRSILDALR
jgi:glycosyltransferase involved in cell wall biosynthesis